MSRYHSTKPPTKPPVREEKEKNPTTKQGNLQKTFSRTWQSFDWRKIDSLKFEWSDMHWICWGSLLYPRKYFQLFYPNELISKRLKGPDCLSNKIVSHTLLANLLWFINHGYRREEVWKNEPYCGTEYNV